MDSARLRDGGRFPFARAFPRLMTYLQQNMPENVTYLAGET